MQRSALCSLRCLARPRCRPQPSRTVLLSFQISFSLSKGRRTRRREGRGGGEREEGKGMVSREVRGGEGRS